MRRRPRSPIQVIGYLLVMRGGWIPRGWRAPGIVLERELLPARGADLFVKHPVLGDLTIPEWRRFHLLHCEHHAKQIRERLAG